METVKSSETWIPAADIAELTGKTVRAVHKRAQKETWHYQVNMVQGGMRKEYNLSGLPEEIRIKYLLGQKENSPTDVGGRSSLASSGPTPQEKEKAKGDLLRLYLAHMKKSRWGSKAPHRKRFMLAYNSGVAYPEIFSALGKVKWKTVEGWKRLVRDGDASRLADRRGYAKRGNRCVTPAQAEILLSVVRSPNAKLISEIIEIARAAMEQTGVADGGLSDATFRRFVNDWTKTHYDEWVFWREGEKGLNDKCAFWIERDYDRIDVGDILVADGHVLNFNIMNPWTGKPKRMTLILWYDMKSNYPCGWEIMPTENTQAISAALRRAILRLGKIPRIVYLDNGKAFKANFFTGVDFEQAGFFGLYARLGIATIFARPYHGQSKPIERFFKTFGELERLSPSYVGTSIEKKPPHLNMGEKIHRKIHEQLTHGATPTLEQTHRAVAAWFDHYAAKAQKGHLSGKRPAEVFEPGRGEGVDPVSLRILMMAEDIRTIRGRGIRFHGTWYYAPALYGRKHAVKILYDLQERDTILVYDENGDDFICEAQVMAKIHPAAKILGTEEDQAELVAQRSMQERLKRKTVSSAREFAELSVIPETRRQLEDAGYRIDARGAGEELEARSSKLKAVQLTRADEARILEEAEEARLRNAECGMRNAEIDEEDRDSEPGYVAEVVDEDAARLRRELERMGEMDRYEKLIEMEVRSMMIPKQWQAFVKYFEMTPAYERHREYFEEHRAKVALMWQVEIADS